MEVRFEVTPAYPQWPGFQIPFAARVARQVSLPVVAAEPVSQAAAVTDVPDHHTQLEDLFGHVRRCERWAQLDDRIDLSWRLDGN